MYATSMGKTTANDAVIARLSEQEKKTRTERARCPETVRIQGISGEAAR